VEVRIVSRKVKNGAAHNDIGKVIGMGEPLNAANLEVFCGEAGVQRFGKLANMLDSSWVRVDRENFGVFPQEIDEVSAVAAASVENAHAGRDVSPQDLIEDVDVDLSEQFLDVYVHQKEAPSFRELSLARSRRPDRAAGVFAEMQHRLYHPAVCLDKTL